MPEALHTNPTQITGLIVFALAASACTLAARGRRAPWRALAITQWACVAEIVFGTRFRVHDAVDAALKSRGVYEFRPPWQIALLVVVCVLAVLCLRSAWRWHERDAAAGRALAASIVAVSLFLVESVSLHQVDVLLYRQTGPVLAIALAWLAVSAVVVVSGLRAARR